MRMQVTYPQPYVAVVTVQGDLDRNGCAALEQRLTALACENSSFVVVDLAQALVPDAMGLHGLLEAVRCARRQQCLVLLVAPTARLRASLKACMLDRKYPIYTSVQEALEALSFLPQYL